MRSLLAHAPLRALGDRPPGRSLDVGAGRGDVSAALVARGWTATIVEPSPSGCAAALARGVDAREGTLATVALEPGAYDAAIFQHSLEHVADPVADLLLVAAALRPGGLLLVTVPNFGSWQARRFGGRWYHLDLPRHRTHFTARGLERALAQAGLEVVEQTTSTSTVGLPASVQYALAGRCLFPGGLGLRIASGLCILAAPARPAARPGRGWRRRAARRRAPASLAAPARGERALDLGGDGPRRRWIRVRLGARAGPARARTPPTRRPATRR